MPPLEEEAAEPEAPAEPSISIDPRRAVRRQGSNGSVMALVMSLLVFALTGVAAYMAWPHLDRALSGAGKRPRERVIERVIVQEAEPAADPAARPKPETSTNVVAVVPRPTARRQAAPAPRDEPEPEARPEPVATQPADPAPEREPQPEPEPEPEAPVIDVERINAEVDKAVTKAFTAIRKHEFKAAARALDGVTDLALDDQDATDRVYRWKQFLEYAKAYPRLRDKALTSGASSAATYDLGKRQIGVIELNKQQFIYRDSKTPGRNLRVPRDEIPSDVERAVVSAWFGRDGRAANHLFLGAGALARMDPDREAARREWETAAAGGEEHASLLLDVLDDPVVSGQQSQ